MQREDAARLSIPDNIRRHDYPRSVTAKGECIESEGKWMYYAPGSGVSISLGKTRAFVKHSDAVSALLHRKCLPDAGAFGFRRKQGVQCLEDFTELVRAALESGYDTLQFIGHPDQRCGQMRIEIVDVRAASTGRFSPLHGTCGLTALGGGWGGEQPCNCSTKLPCLNCVVGQPPTPVLGAHQEGASASLAPSAAPRGPCAIKERLPRSLLRALLRTPAQGLHRVCEVNVQDAQLARFVVSNRSHAEYRGLGFTPSAFLQEP